MLENYRAFLCDRGEIYRFIDLEHYLGEREKLLDLLVGRRGKYGVEREYFYCFLLKSFKIHGFLLIFFLIS